MAVTGYIYGQLVQQALTKIVDLVNDNIMIMLGTAYTPSLTTHLYKDVAPFTTAWTEVANGNGYTTGGMALPATKSVVMSAGTPNCKVVYTTSGSIAWTASTITFRYAVLYDNTPSSNKPLIGYIDFGANVSDVAGTLTITPDATYGLLEITT